MKKVLALLILCCCMTVLSCAASKQQPQKIDQNQSGDFVPVEKQPIQIDEVAPEYPAQARLLGITGTVWVKALIDKSGKVIEVRVMEDAGENVDVFKDSAIKAAYQTKWEPAKSKEGEPLAVWVTYRVDYNLK